VLKGKSTSLSQFFRVARNLMSMVFKNGEPEVGDVEEEYWKLVIDRDAHMQVCLPSKL
jgi:protein Jumonji